MFKFLLGFLAALIAAGLAIKFADVGAIKWLAAICAIKGNCSALEGIF